MKQFHYKHAVMYSLLFCIALLTVHCKQAIYAPAAGDTIQLNAVPMQITLGESVEVSITVIGIKANGQPMPDNTLVRLSADSGTFHDNDGNPVEAVLLPGGRGKAAYRLDETFTGDSIVIAAQSGSAVVTPEQLIITLTDITRLYMTAAPLKLDPPGGTTIIIVTAYDSLDQVVPGKKIFLETTAGTLAPSSPIVTEPNGKATATLETTEPASVTASYKDISKTIEINVGVNEPPVASFEFSPQDPVMGNRIYFVSTSTDSDGTIESHQWNFGDGSTGSTEEHPYHDFRVTDEAKEYQVVLTVTDDGGKKGSAAQTVAFALEESIPPTADFSFTPETPVVGENIQFISLSTDEDGTIETYKWNFEDKDPPEYDESQNPQYSYSKSGVYAVTLEVTDNGNNSNSITKPITIIEKENQPPVAAFTFSPENPRSGENVLFNAVSSTDPEGDTLKYYWYFGDEEVGVAPKEEGPLTTHAYDVYEEETFTVTLTVEDTAGNKATDYKEITVRPTPVAVFTFSPAEPELDGSPAEATVTFNASSSKGDIKTYKWFFGDGQVTPAKKENVVVMHTYTSADDFRVTLTVTDINNNTDTTFMVITIKEP